MEETKKYANLSKTLKEYGLKSIQDAKDFCQSFGIDVEKNCSRNSTNLF